MEPNLQRPSKLRKTIALGLLALFAVIIAAAVYAVRFSRFVPSPSWAEISFWIGVAFGIGGIASGFLPLPPSKRPIPFVMKSVWGRAPIFGLLLFASTYLAFLSGLPAWYTFVAGTFDSQVVTVKGWQASVAGSRCVGPYVEEAPRQITVCLPPILRTSTSPGTRLVLEGKGTPLGINVSTVDIQGNQILPALPSPFVSE